jgi:hypothetical protein
MLVRQFRSLMPAEGTAGVRGKQARPDGPRCDHQTPHCRQHSLLGEALGQLGRPLLSRLAAAIHCRGGQWRDSVLVQGCCCPSP